MKRAGTSFARFAWLVSVFISLTPVTTSARGLPDTFGAFWLKFRGAVISKNVSEIALLTKFPLEIGFESDETHSADNKHLSISQFNRFFDAELKCPYPYESGLPHGNKPRTNEIVKQVEPPKPRAGIAAVDPYYFTNTPAGWRMTAIQFIDTSELSARLHGRC